MTDTVATDLATAPAVVPPTAPTGATSTAGPNILDTAPLAVAPAEPQTPTPGFWQATIAGGRQSVLWGALYYAGLAQAMSLSHEPDPNFNLGETLRKNGLSAYGPQFAEVTNQSEFDYKLASLRQQREDMRTIAGSSGAGALAGLLTAQVADAPILAIPFLGGLGKVADGAYVATRGIEAAQFGAQLAAGDLLEQTGKQFVQPDPPSLTDAATSVITSGLLGGAARFAGTPLRGAAIMAAPGALQMSVTGDYSPQNIVNVGASAVMGALIGHEGYSRLSEADRKVGAWAIDKMLTPVEDLKPSDFTPPRAATETPPEAYAPQTAGASVLTGGSLSAADPTHSLDEMSLAGGTFPRLLNSITGRLTPNDRAFGSLVPAEADTYFKLFDNPLLTAMADKGETPSPGGSAEGFMKQLWTTHFAAAEAEHQQVFQSMREAGVSMKPDVFDTLVGDALRNNDQALPHDIPIPEEAEKFIAQAASNWREKLFDPLSQRAVALGLLSDEDLQHANADSYFRTIPDRDRLIAHSDQFFDEHVPYWQQQLEAEYGASWKTTRDRIAKLDQRIARLQMAPEDRVAAMASLRARAEELDANNPGAIDHLAKIADAIDRGDKELAAQLKASAGPDVLAYQQQRAELRNERRTLNEGYAASAEKAARLEQRMGDLEDRSVGDISRVSARVAKGLDRIKSLDPAKHVDKIDAIHRQLSELLARLERSSTLADELKARGATEAAVPGRPDADILAKTSARLDRVAAGQKTRLASIRSLVERLDAAEELDPEARIAEIREGLKGIVSDAAKRVMDKGEELAALREKAQAYDPSVVDARVKAARDYQAELRNSFSERWGDASGHEADLNSDKTPDFADAAHDIVQNVFDKWTGRDVGDGSARMPLWAPKIERGPMKDRTYNVPERMKIDYTLRNVRDVGYSYARQMAGSIALADRFDRMSPAEIEGRVKLQYDDLRQAIENAKSDEEIRALLRQGDKEPLFNNPLDKRTTKEKALQLVDQRWRTAREDIRAGIELTLGTYKIAENGSNYARMLRNLRTFNYLVEGGGFLLAHLGFIVRPAMVHGFDRELDLISNFADRMKSVEILGEEAKRSGIALQQALHHRILTAAEIGDPLAKGTAVERAMRSMGNMISRLSGLGIFLDVIQKHDAVLTQQRILKAVTGLEPDAKFLGSVDISPNLAERIAAQFREHGETWDDGMHIPNTEAWTDAKAVQAYRNAIWKQGNITVPQAGFGDLPLMSHHPLGGAMLQFQRFLLSQQQRVFMRGVQQDNWGTFAMGASSMVAIGMLIGYLKAAAAGRETFDKFKEEMAADPRRLVAEGIEKSGIFPYLFWANNMARNVAHGNAASALVGPAGGTLNRIPTAARGVANLAQGKDVPNSQRNAIIHMIPGGSIIGVRQALQGLLDNGTTDRYRFMGDETQRP